MIKMLTLPDAARHGFQQTLAGSYRGAAGGARASADDVA